MVSGAMLRTHDPVWIGGSHPYGEYFDGLIDEVRIYDRALSQEQVRSEMTTPVGGASGPTTTGLVGAWAFDRGAGRWASDGSGGGNRGTLDGATWVARGRFGEALRFDGTGALVRVPVSPSLDLSDAMTLSAWVRPARTQSGWRTVVHHQTDAYFLMAGGASAAPGAADDVRLGLVVAATACLCLALLVGHRRWRELGTSWWQPLALFLIGSAIDVWLTGSGTVIGACAVAIWYAVTARRHAVATGMLAVAVLLVGVTVAALVGQLGHDLGRDGGAVARSAALGLVLVVAGLFALRSDPRRAETRDASAHLTACS